MSDMNTYLASVGKRLRLELDDLSDLARAGNETGFAQQSTYLMGYAAMLLIVRETGTPNSPTPTADQIDAGQMALTIQDAIFVAREAMGKKLHKLRKGDHS